MATQREEVSVTDSKVAPGYLFDRKAYKFMPGLNREDMKITECPLRYNFETWSKEFMDKLRTSSLFRNSTWVKDLLEENAVDAIMVKAAKILEKRSDDVPPDEVKYTVTSIYYKYQPDMLLIYSKTSVERYCEELTTCLDGMICDAMDSVIPRAFIKDFKCAYIYPTISVRGTKVSSLKHSLEEFCRILKTTPVTVNPSSALVMSPVSTKPANAFVNPPRLSYAKITASKSNNIGDKDSGKSLSELSNRESMAVNVNSAYNKDEVPKVHTVTTPCQEKGNTEGAYITENKMGPWIGQRTEVGKCRSLGRGLRSQKSGDISSSVAGTKVSDNIDNTCNKTEAKVSGNHVKANSGEIFGNMNCDCLNQETISLSNKSRTVISEYVHAQSAHLRPRGPSNLKANVDVDKEQDWVIVNNSEQFIKPDMTEQGARPKYNEKTQDLSQNERDVANGEIGFTCKLQSKAIGDNPTLHVNMQYLHDSFTNSGTVASQGNNQISCYERRADQSGSETNGSAPGASNVKTVNSVRHPHNDKSTRFNSVLKEETENMKRELSHQDNVKDNTERSNEANQRPSQQKDIHETDNFNKGGHGKYKYVIDDQHLQDSSQKAPSEVGQPKEKNRKGGSDVSSKKKDVKNKLKSEPKTSKKEEEGASIAIPKHIRNLKVIDGDDYGMDPKSDDYSILKVVGQNPHVTKKQKLDKEKCTMKSRLLNPVKTEDDPCGFQRKYFGIVNNKYPEKVILLLGASGSGKSTIVNFVANYFKENKSADDELIHVESISKTSAITAYTFCWAIDEIPITVIDTPGLNDSSGAEVRDHIQSLKTFLANAASKGLELHAIGFVAQAHLVRLTSSERLVMDYVSTMFGQSVAKHLITLVTFADTQDTPPVVEAMKNYGVDFKLSLKFNNSALSNSKSDEIDDLDRVYWRVCWRNWKKCLKALKDLPALSVNTMKAVQSEIYASTVVESAEKDLQAELNSFFKLCKYEKGMSTKETFLISEQIWELAAVVHRLKHTKESVESIVKDSAIGACKTLQFSPADYIYFLSLAPSRSLMVSGAAIIRTMTVLYSKAKTCYSDMKNVSKNITEFSYCLNCKKDHKMKRIDINRITKKCIGSEVLLLQCEVCNCPADVHGVSKAVSPSDPTKFLYHTRDCIRKVLSQYSIQGFPIPEDKFLNNLNQHLSYEYQEFIEHLKRLR